MSTSYVNEDLQENILCSLLTEYTYVNDRIPFVKKYIPCFLHEEKHDKSMIASMDLFAFLTSICIVLITIVLCLSSYSNSTSELTKERRKTFQNNLYHNIIGFLPTQSSSKFNPQNKNYFKPKPKPKSNHFVSMQFFHDDFWEYERMKRFTKKQNKQASVSKQKKNWRLNALHKGTWNPMEWRSSSNVSNSNNSTFLVHDGTKNDNNYPIQAVNHVTMNNQSEPIMDSPLSNKNTNILHFCFLVHGYNGLSSVGTKKINLTSTNSLDYDLTLFAFLFQIGFGISQICY